MPEPKKSRRLLAGGAPRTRSVLLATGALVVLASPFAVAGTGDVLREGVRNGTTSKETEIVGKFNYKSPTGGYVTRQSNTQTGSNAGGSAIYGCRTQTRANPVPCLRANNLSSGQAFQFSAKSGEIAGTITVGDGGPTKRPFTTNATGVATGLNADSVDNFDVTQILAAARAGLLSTTGKAADSELLDGKDSTVFAERLFAVVEADGTVKAHRGLTTTAGVKTQAGFYRLEFDRDVTSCAVTASQGARNNAFAGGRIISANKAVAPAGIEGRVNVRTERFSGGAFIDEDQDFDVQVIC